jgi:hypothetical protein
VTNPLSGGRILGSDRGTEGPSETPIMQALARQVDLNAALWKEHQTTNTLLGELVELQRVQARAVELEHLPHAPGIAEIELPGRTDGPFYGVYCIACTQASQSYCPCQKPGENAINMPEKWPLAAVLVPATEQPDGGT